MWWNKEMVRSAGIEQYPVSHIQQGFNIYNYCFVSSYVSSFLNVPPFFYILKATYLFYFSGFRLLWHGWGARWGMPIFWVSVKFQIPENFWRLNGPSLRWSLACFNQYRPCLARPRVFLIIVWRYSGLLCFFASIIWLKRNRVFKLLLL